MAVECIISEAFSVESCEMTSQTGLSVDSMNHCVNIKQVARVNMTLKYGREGGGPKVNRFNLNLVSIHAI